MTDVLQELRDKVADGLWPGDFLAVDSCGPLRIVTTATLYKAFSGSLDAAKALHEALLPGWVVGIHKPPDHGNRAKCALFWIVNLGSADGKVEIDSVIGADPARAWLLAILDALIQGDKADG